MEENNVLSKQLFNIFKKSFAMDDIIKVPVLSILKIFNTKFEYVRLVKKRGCIILEKGLKRRNNIVVI